MVVPRGLPAEWLPGGFEFVVDDGLSPADLDRVDGVITGATLAIAETGTVVLQKLRDRDGARRHWYRIIIFAWCGSRTWWRRCRRPSDGSRPRRIGDSFVSGPSATADIEMTRIKGVHGPRFLDVVLVG